jgi:hypothetical protein
MKEIFRRQISRPFSRKISRDPLPGVSAGHCHCALVDEEGIIMTDGYARQIGNGSSVWDVLCGATPVKVRTLL